MRRGARRGSHRGALVELDVLPLLGLGLVIGRLLLVGRLLLLVVAHLGERVRASTVTRERAGRQRADARGLTFEGDGTLASLPPRFLPLGASRATATGASLLEELSVALGALNMPLFIHLRREGMVAVWCGEEGERARPGQGSRRQRDVHLDEVGGDLAALGLAGVRGVRGGREDGGLVARELHRLERPHFVLLVLLDRRLLAGRLGRQGQGPLDSVRVVLRCRARDKAGDKS